MRFGLSEGRENAQHQIAEFSNVATINNASKEFERMVFWLTEMNISLSDESVAKSEAKEKALLSHLVIMKEFAPDEAAEIESKLPAIRETYLNALDTFSFDEDLEGGKKIMITARELVNVVDAIFLKVADKISNDSNMMSRLVISDSDSLLTISKFVIVFIMMAIIATVIIVIINVIRPLEKITYMINELSSGHYETEVIFQDRNDEIGDISRAVQIFKDNKIASDKLEETQRQERISKQRRAEKIEVLVNGFEETAANVIQTVSSAATELYENAQVMLSTVTDANKSSANVASSAEQTSSNVKAVAAASEQLSASTTEISSQVSKTSRVVSESVHKGKMADSTTESLSNATSKIGEVVELIQGIAEQINLLALNATIESARAGDAGKGFAVVANEVKNLAGQTSSATEEIAGLIHDVQSSSKEVIDVLRSFREGVESIDEYTSGIAAAIEQQSNTTTEINSNMQTAATGVATVSNDISSINKSTNEANTSSGLVLDASQTLSKQAETLSQEVSSFLTQIKTA